MKILIVDDNEFSREIIKRCLADYGDCILAEDGEQAVAAFETALQGGEPYDLICMDIMMPGMDGQTALRRIRGVEEAMEIKPGKEVNVMMISALDDDQNISESFLRGNAIGYIIKPVTVEKIVHEMAVMGFWKES